MRTQSKSTIPQPAVEAGSVKPDALHGIMMVEEFIWYKGGWLGSCASAPPNKPVARSTTAGHIFLEKVQD